MYSEWRVYDPRCDHPDVALRAVALKVEQDRWDLFESSELDWASAREKVQDLTDRYGSFKSGRWRNSEMMALLRRRVPELVPVAETWQMLYVLVTVHERKVRKTA